MWHPDQSAQLLTQAVVAGHVDFAEWLCPLAPFFRTQESGGNKYYCRRLVLFPKLHATVFAVTQEQLGRFD